MKEKDMHENVWVLVCHEKGAMPMQSSGLEDTKPTKVIFHLFDRGRSLSKETEATVFISLAIITAYLFEWTE